MVVHSDYEISNLLVSSLLCLLALSSQLLEIQAWTPRLSSQPQPLSSLFYQSISSTTKSFQSLKIHHSSNNQRHLQTSTAIFESSDGSVETTGNKSEDSEVSEAVRLKRSAERIRLQAQEMEIKLIDEKLTKLNKKMDDANEGKKKLTSEERMDLTKQIQMLEYRLNPEDKKEEMEAMLQKDREERMGQNPTQIQKMSEGLTLNGEEMVTIKLDAETGNIPEISIVDSKTKEVLANYSSSSNEDFEDLFQSFDDVFGQGFNIEGANETFEIRDCLWQSNETEFVGPLSTDDLKVVDELEGKWQELLKLRDATKDKKNPFDAFSPSSTTNDDDDEAAALDDELKQQEVENSKHFANRTFLEARAGNISQGELSFVKFANSAINFCRDNLPFVVEIALNVGEGYKISEEDPLYMERFNLFAEAYDSNLFSLRRNKLEEGVETAFCQEVLDSNPKLFKRTAKPRRVGSAFLFDGKAGNEDGHQLMKELNEALQKSSLKDQLNLFYIRDPSPQIELDEIQQADFIQSNGGDEDIGKALALANSFEPPALLITGKNLESDKALNTRLGFTAFAFLSTVTTIGSYYYPNTDPNYFQELFAGLQSPILAYLLGNLAFQHVIQVLLALKGSFKVSPLPTFIPGLWGLPLVGSSISINSPPKSKNDMFDFAFAAPFVGFLVSYGMIILGLEHTMQTTNAAEIAQLPHFELDELKQSFLTSATIESVMGTNVLLSLGDGVSSAVPLDPMVIAGYLGLMINAIQMIPTMVETNGGRAASAALGRFSVGNGGLAGLSILFLLIQAYRGGSPSLNFVALIYTFRIYFQPEMPCENDVDNASPARLAALGIGVALAFFTLSPS